MSRTYGYKMFDATMSVWKQYEHDCYMHKIAPRPHEKFKYVRFLSINDAIVKIKNIFIPLGHEKLAKITWQLEEEQTLLIKKVEFSSDMDSELYQQAVERAWALGGHLDQRVEQIYYD